MFVKFQSFIMSWSKDQLATLINIEFFTGIRSDVNCFIIVSGHSIRNKVIYDSLTSRKFFSSDKFHHYQYRQINENVVKCLKVAMEQRRKST